MYETIRIVQKLKPKYVIWENVKNLLSKKHRHNFDNYLDKMSELGYKNYYQVLNAKDYGIPQNRERVFTISIRQDIDTEYIFPKKQELKLRLKDMLESNVDEKYFLSGKQVERMSTTTYVSAQTDKRVQDDVCRTLAARDWKDPKCVRIGNIYGEGKGGGFAGNVYEKEGLSPALQTMQGENGQQLEISNREYANAITSVQKDSMVAEPQVVKVGELEESKGDGNVPIVQEINKKAKHQQDLVQSEDDICRTIPAGTHGSTPHLLKTVVSDKRLQKLVDNTEFEKGKVLNLDTYNQTTNENISQCLTEPNHNNQRLFDGLRIRKLTPKECWRLMRI